MNEFLTSNEWQWRLLRTVAQGVLGVVVANVDMLVGAAVLDPAWRALVAALVMAALCPVMAELGAARVEEAALAGVGGCAGDVGGSAGDVGGVGGCAGGGRGGDEGGVGRGGDEGGE